jgi:hypothetical protein
MHTRDAPSGQGSSQRSPADFISWRELSRYTETQADALETQLEYKRGGMRTIRETHKPADPWTGRKQPVKYDGYDKVTPFAAFRSAGADTLAGLGQPAIDVSTDGGATGDFVSFNSPVALVANPYALGWNYQSFGVWEGREYSYGSIHSTSFGAPTPASAVPSGGTATFAGKLSGFYVSPAGEGSIAAADLTVRADFSLRSLAFASTGTVTTRDLKSPTAAPNLNLSGTLTYSPASNQITGTLGNASGTMQGRTTARYYGPAAQELGGVFALKSATTVETFAGAYGAKR